MAKIFSQARQFSSWLSRAEAGFLPGRFGAFDDEGRGVGVELIGMRPDPAVLGLFEDEGKGVVEFLLRAEPDEFVFAGVDGGLEIVGELRAGPGVQAVGGDDDVVVLRQLPGIGDLGLETQIDAKLPGPLLQQHQEFLAADAGKAMAARDDALATIMHGDIVPIGEVTADGRGAGRIVGGDIIESLVGEYDAPAERIVRPVALEHGDVVAGVAQLHADREIEARGAAAETSNLHALPPVEIDRLRKHRTVAKIFQA